MDDDIFLHFVGDELVTKFKSFDAILITEGFNKEFLAIYKIWNFFGKPDKVKSDAHFGQEENAEPEDPELLKIPNGNTEHLDLADEDESTIESEKDGVSDIKLQPLLEAKNCNNVHIIENIVIKQADTVSANVPFVSTLSLPSTSKNISDYLEVPDRPERKNKRDIERVPFAITSRLYQESFEIKRALKLEEEKNKLERKRKREAEAAAKTEKTAKTAKTAKTENRKKTKAEVTQNNICFLCKKRVTKNHLTCDECKNNCHRRCIPKIHKNHVPDINDDDLFMCHICYKEESEGEADEEIEREEDDYVNQMREDDAKVGENDNESDSTNEEKQTRIKCDDVIDEEKEIDELFNMYKSNCQILGYK